MNVLIVDDEPIIRIGLKTLVEWEKFGFQHVGEAEDGIDAWEQIDSLQVDIVITDLLMPRMDGLELIRLIQNHSRSIAVVVLSCMDDFAYVKEAMKHGAKDYILKPTMEPDQLMAILLTVREDLLRAREMRRQLTSFQQGQDKQIIVNNSMDELRVLEPLSRNPFVIRAFRYMDENYASNISTIDIAEHVRLSRSYISDLYGKETDESLSEALTRIRISKAKAMLRKGDLKIYEIADAVGFLDAKVFAKAFKRLEGCTPREYGDEDAKPD
ncbi:response regulator [Paenibacillus psychroresistens]|uniref:Response regulator n=1 Tax=Paenibacillus psychroresistens TaxID=1778678 RepID=A0A6B8RIS9_9BACL|nr:response regulator [Paenibacillus psychroresistens]QGQ95515.1 response regulator [Paenibacillus psychroresistens]